MWSNFSEESYTVQKKKKNQASQQTLDSCGDIEQIPHQFLNSESQPLFYR